MSEAREQRIRVAQRVLDRSDGDIGKALTKAAFRWPVAALLAQSHPKAVEAALRSRTDTARSGTDPR